MASGISGWVSRVWDGAQGYAASARDGAGRVKQSAIDWAKSTGYEPLPEERLIPLGNQDELVDSIVVDPTVPLRLDAVIANPGNNLNLDLLPNFRIKGRDDDNEAPIPSDQWLVLHRMHKPKDKAFEKETRPFYCVVGTIAQERAILKRVAAKLKEENKVSCPCGCAGVYVNKGFEEKPQYHWRTSLLRWTIAAVQEAVVDLFNSMYYLAIIGGVGLYSALLFGSTPITFLLHGPVAGTVAGVALATVVTSVVSKVIFGGGIGIMKAKHVPFENHQHTRRSKIAIAVITFLASVFFSYKMLSFSRTRSICQWVGDSFSSEQISQAFSLFDPFPSLSAASLGSQVTQGIFQTRFFSYGLIASGLYTWFNKAVTAVPQMREALRKQPQG